MVVSFKVSKEGKLYRHKPPLNTSFLVEDDAEQNDAVSGASEEKKKKKAKSDLNSSEPSVETRENKSIAQISDNDISFTLSLFPSGYSIRKPVQNEPGSQNSIDVPKFLHPYDRASETLFSSIECGRFPGDILDDIPCKFINGATFCELRDYRECLSERGGVSPIINRVCLRMSLENIVKDIPAIADNDWTYGDLMEVESRILKALQPQLCLDPIPKLDRLSENPAQTKLNLGLRRMRLKRLAQMNEDAVSMDNKIQGKRVCIDKFSDNLRLADPGSLVQQSALVNLNKQNNVSTNVLPMRNNSFGPDSSLLAQPNQEKYHIGVGSPRMMRDQWSGALLNQTMSSPCGQDMLNPFSDNAIHGKRDYQDAQSSPLTNKKPRLMHTSGSDGNLPLLAPQTDNLHGSDLHWKNALMQQHQQQPQPVGRGVQYSNNGMQKFSQQVFEGGMNQEGGAMPFTIGQEGIRYNLKEEPVEMERLDKPEQRMPQQFMRSGFPQSPWNNLGQPLDNNSRKEDSFQKRKVVQSPRVSAGCLPQSPLSSKSGEFSSGSIGGQFGGVVNSGLVLSQKEKSAVTSVPFMGGNPSFTSSANDNMQRQHQAHVPAKRRTTSLPKTSAISGVGSPASVSNMNMPINTSSPPVGAQPLSDQTVLDRFSKIEKVAKRFQLNDKNIKVEEHPRKPYTFSAQSIAGFLANDSNNESFNDETCKMMSKSLVGGSINVCKRRVLNFIQTEHIVQGNGYQLVPKARARLIMSEKLNDGTVTFHIGDVEDADYLAAEDYLPVLPNTHMADLLAAQFCSLMQRDEYHNTEDIIQPKPVRTNPIATSQHNAPGVSPRGATSEMQQQFSEGISSGQPSNSDILKPNVPINSTSHNLQRMLPLGNAQGMQISQGNSIHSRTTQQPEPLSTLHQQQQPQQNSLTPHQQLQRSPMMNSMQHLNNLAQNANIHLGAHNMVNKQQPSSLQLQLLQQQQPQQLHQQMQQRKIMAAGLGGTVGMGNVGNNNNIVGLGSFSNVMGIRSGTGISPPMGTTISSMGNMNQNPVSSHLSNILRSGTINQAQAAAFINMKTKQNRASMLSGAQSSIGGMTGARQMNPGGVSMLGSGLNRGNNMNQMMQQQQQRTTMAGAMGPPKLMPGMNNNVYMNQQQQHMQQIQQQQMQMMQQQQQMQMMQQQQQLQQQETTSPLHGVLSPPPQMGSPSGSMGIPHHQQASPQQMSQRTPMSPQLSAGGGSVHLSPASPQLSSQTMGSVGNIANSPMELQGVNNSNSGNNS